MDACVYSFESLYMEYEGADPHKFICAFGDILMKLYINQQNAKLGGGQKYHLPS